MISQTYCEVTAKMFILLKTFLYDYHACYIKRITTNILVHICSSFGKELRLIKGCHITKYYENNSNKGILWCPGSVKLSSPDIFDIIIWCPDYILGLIVNTKKCNQGRNRNLA